MKLPHSIPQTDSIANMQHFAMSPARMASLSEPSEHMEGGRGGGGWGGGGALSQGLSKVEKMPFRMVGLDITP